MIKRIPYASPENTDLELGIRYLRNDVLVGETDDKAILGRVVLVLGLGDQLTTGVVVRLAL